MSLLSRCIRRLAPVAAMLALAVSAGAARPAGKAEAAKPTGAISMSPTEPQPAGGTAPVRFEIEIGEGGLPEGGAIVLRGDRWRTTYLFRMTPRRATCEGSKAVFRLEEGSMPKHWPRPRHPPAWIATLESGGPLAEGAKVLVEADATYNTASNIVATYTGYVTPDPEKNGRPLAGKVVFQSVGGPARRLTCVAEARPVRGQPGRVTVAAVDEHGNPAIGFRGKVALRGFEGAPAPYAFTAEDKGSHTFRAVVPPDRVTRVVAVSGEMRARANPILPRRDDEPGVWFGETHSHCNISGDGVGDPDLAYEYARRFHGLDFAALSDHTPRGPRWELAVETANRHNAPGDFVTFLGYEWSHSRCGHRNLYYRGDEGHEQPKGLKDNMDSWWALLDKQGLPALTIPHHPNTHSAARRKDGSYVWGPVDWSSVNHKYQRIVEICQNRGSFEAPGGPNEELRIKAKDAGASVQTALAKGHRLGFIGSTDTHSGRPGLGAARAVILSDELTRGALFDALYDRRCYATTGDHILVFFSVNAQPMGREARFAAPDIPRAARWRVVGTSPIKRVDLLRNNEVVESWDGEGDDMSGVHTRVEPLGETEWWYLRVIQENTQLAWSSPIWFDLEQP